MKVPQGQIGILGGGQLARMLAIAAAEMGLTTHIYAPEDNICAKDCALYHHHADYDDEKALEDFARAVKVISFEFENVPSQTASFLAQRQRFYPPPKALMVTQNRVEEKTFLRSLNIPTAQWSQKPHLEIIFPAIVKTNRFGYDGKGQITVCNLEELDEAVKQLGSDIIIERKIDFIREIALAVACNPKGDFIAYDIVQTHHHNGILRKAIAPAFISAERQKDALEIARAITRGLDYVGLLTIEMFETDKGLLVNELAPRVHNSYHWTINACAISQFSQHIRAINNLPLMRPERFADAIMTNLLGDEVNHIWQDQNAKPNRAIHIYNKGEAKSGRKMGHITELLPLGTHEVKGTNEAYRVNETNEKTGETDI